MAETNPVKNPSELPMSDRAKSGYGFYGRHDSSQIEVSKEKNPAPTIYPGSGMAKDKSGIKRIIHTTGGF